MKEIEPTQAPAGFLQGALDVGAVSELERLLAAHIDSGGMVVLTTHQEVQVVTHAVLRVDLDLHTAALLAA